jgi:hypothetical protein
MLWAHDSTNQLKKRSLANTIATEQAMDVAILKRQ